DPNGRRVATGSIRVSERGAVGRLGLDEVASAIINETTPRLCGLTIIVGGGATKHPRVERIAIDPVPVSIVPEVLAAAHAVPDSWGSFQVIDHRSRIWWLIDKKDGEVHALRSALFSQMTGPAHEIVDHFAAMGFVNVAVLGEADA